MQSFRQIVSVLAAIVLTGCASYQNTTTNVPVQSAPVDGSTTNQVELSPHQRYIVSAPLDVQASVGVVGGFNSRMIFLADQLERNADRKDLNNTFIVTSFSNLNKLSETTAFGRLVSENLIHELQVRKWQVFEVRLTRDVIINETGEFTLSRDIRKLKDQYKIGGIVTGTYSVAGDDIILNARVIDINSGLVVSSSQIHLPSNWFTNELLTSDDHQKTIRIVGNTPTAPEMLPSVPARPAPWQQ